MQFATRIAALADLPALEQLIARSIRSLGATDYSQEQIEAALRGAFGVDTQLIRDATYFVVEHETKLVACGGWSKRRTLFGSDARSGRDASELNPSTDAAKIRAFFVDPLFARQGIGKMLLNRCELEAHAQGFWKYELMATLPGVRLYQACGYIAAKPIQHPLSPSLSIEFVPMTKVHRKEG